MIPIKVIWPGGEHQMRLALAQLEGLQGKVDAGPEFLLHKIRLGQWTASDLFEVIRWGLIGGGMDRMDAEKLIQRVIDQHPLGEFKGPAIEVLAHSVYGPPDDPVGEIGPVGGPTPENQKTESGSSAHTTD
ncbi:MAG: gene transfer agent family protein [Mangrovicoccus sp.]